MNTSSPPQKNEDKNKIERNGELIEYRVVEGRRLKILVLGCVASSGNGFGMSNTLKMMMGEAEAEAVDDANSTFSTIWSTKTRLSLLDPSRENKTRSRG
ncbi:hypothetical protein M0802_007941 [Mischocyttarus mexicanus]|nr:hypothetical protein M0802_007941 [Mischocyttarus mexicanus]